MSYILDALKRAEAERERDCGQVPGLHTRPLAEAAPPRLDGRSRRAIAGLGGTLAMLLAGALAWVLTTRETPSPAATEPARHVVIAPLPATAASATPMSRPAPKLAPAPTDPAPAVPSSASTLSPALAPSPSGLASSPALVTPSVPASPALAASSAPPRAPAAPQVSSAGAAPAAPTATAANRKPGGASAAAPAVAPLPRDPALGELPEQLRRQLPALTVSGSTYSENPTYRMLILNGQVFHEGQQVAAELVVEHIGPKAVTLAFRGQRFTLGY